MSENGAVLDDNFLYPLTVLRLEKLWPHARKQGKEIGQIYRVGYYCKDCGKDTIWLVDAQGNYGWTVDFEFVKAHFKLIARSKKRSIFGKGRPKIGPIKENESF